MKPYIVNLLNAIVLVFLGLWGYFISEAPSVTAFIPVVTGFILLILTPWFRRENKVAAHIAVVLTLLIIIGLIKPLTAAIGRDDNGALFRVSFMMITSLLAMVFFIKSFIDVRRKKN